VYAKAHCERHYRQLLRSGEVRRDPVPAGCAVVGCGRRAVTRGWCHGHYLRWSRTGDVRADVPLTRDARDTCTVEGCERGVHSATLCRSHYERQRLRGDVSAGGPVREVTGTGFLHHGYWWVPVPEADRWLVGGATSAAEHRLVVARRLGRPLEPDESVHHRNGDRLDNSDANLELWSRFQPSGQRVRDKLAAAYELVRRYGPDAWAVLQGVRGVPRDAESPGST
jgi:hypothetical protein